MVSQPKHLFRIRYSERNKFENIFTIRMERITDNKSGDLVRFRFRNGMTNQFPQIFFRVCLCSDHVGHAQATTAGHTYEKMRIPEIFFRFRFRNPAERKSQILGFLFFARTWETDLYTPQVLGGAALFDNSAQAVYKNPVP